MLGPVESAKPRGLSHEAHDREDDPIPDILDMPDDPMPDDLGLYTRPVHASQSDTQPVNNTDDDVKVSPNGPLDAGSDAPWTRVRTNSGQ